MPVENSFVIRYVFDQKGGNVGIYELYFDLQSLSVIRREPREPPSWAKLHVSKCAHCPLDEKLKPHCPIGVNLADLVEHFKDTASYARVSVTVTTEARQYRKEVPIQEGLFSIFELLMVTSGCPKMNFLRPLARFHLPFSTIEETIVRNVSIYLLGQYFLHKRGGTADLDLRGLKEKYDETGKVYLGLIDRIKTIIKSGDANQNTITTLDTFAKLLSMALKKDLEKYAHFFIFD